jgi:2-dehydro-3-deoxy-D-gluconate 5-dehydrogenase
MPHTRFSAFDLTGRRALVTGGAGSLGRAMAEGLHDAGADVCLLGRSESVVAVAEAIARDGGPAAHAIVCDLGDRVDLARGFAQAVDRVGGIDVLVTSHGISRPADTLAAPVEDWDATLEVNLSSVYELCRLAAARMRDTGGGKIVNVASMLSFFGGYRAAAYAASKGGVAQLTKALANEWASLGINVNAIAPGYIKSRLNEHYWSDPAAHDAILVRLPAGRWGEPDDLKGPVVFLASPASDYLHGVVLPVDGGYAGR